jgi:hypothetical protein
VAAPTSRAGGGAGAAPRSTTLRRQASAAKAASPQAAFATEAGYLRHEAGGNEASALGPGGGQGDGRFGGRDLRRLLLRLRLPQDFSFLRFLERGRAASEALSASLRSLPEEAHWRTEPAAGLSRRTCRDLVQGTRFHARRALERTGASLHTEAAKTVAVK